MLLTGLSLAAHAEAATMLLYERSEAGSASDMSRVIVTRDYLRMDLGAATDDYLLYDRKARVVYSVVHGDKTIASIEARPMDLKPPLALQLDEESVPLGGHVPDIGGRTPVQRRMLAGGRVCLEVVAVPGLLQDAVDARREMTRVIAAEHAATLPVVPADVHDACDLAVNTFNADWVTRFGLPIHEQDFAGNTQALVDYSDKFAAVPELFKLPDGYRRYSISALK
jgi:hypothetical protein